MYLEEYLNSRNIADETRIGYNQSVGKYTKFYDASLEELIDEAIYEEDEKYPMRRRSIKSRLLNFRRHLLDEQNLAIKTVNGHVGRIKSIYRYFEIQIPDLPQLEDDEYEITYLDLPNKKHVRKAVKMSGLKIASLILFMASSGTGRKECEQLTVRDFIDACDGYYTETGLMDILEEMDNSIEPIVPTFKMYRVKKHKTYYTFCTPEAAEKIIEWLILKNEILEGDDKKLSLDEPVWSFSVRNISYHFQSINDAMDWGYKGKYRFFRPHTLRKFHASNIGLSPEKVDFLQGRSKDRLHATYIKENPTELKELYMSVMDNVTIGTSDKQIIHEDFTININVNLFGSDYGITI